MAPARVLRTVTAMTLSFKTTAARRALTGTGLIVGLFVGALLLAPSAGAVSFPDAAVEDGDAPHVVSIWRGSAGASDARLSFVCTGTLISATQVLTAAHCVPSRTTASKARIAIRVGGTSIPEADGEVVNVRGWFAHERYSAKRALNDVAILRLARAVKLPTYGTITNAREDNSEPLTLMGWGENQNGDVDGLNMVEQFSYTGDAREYFNQFNSKLQIAAGKWFEDEEVFGGSCRGDSGGPLFARGSQTRIVGIVSYGAPDCTLDVPGVYTRVGRFAEWVDRRSATLDKRYGHPGPVANVEASAGDGFATLTWQAPVDDGGSPITGYEVSMREGLAEEWVPIGRTKELEFIAEGLQTGKSYEFRVAAINASGSKPVCGCATVELVERQDAPGMPENAKVIVTATTVELSWSAPNVLSGGKVDGYVVRYRQENGTTGPTKWLTLPRTKNTSVRVENLPQKAELTFEIVAVGPGGTSEPLVVAAATALTPDPPQDPRATSRTGDSITVTWDPPESDGGARVTSYLVTVSRLDNGVTPRTYTVSGDETSFTATGLRVNTKYAFQIVAVNLAGSSRAVRLETATAMPPEAVEGLFATPRGTSVKLAWPAAPNDNGSPITHYVLTWQEANGAGRGQAQCPAVDLECIATDLRPATDYYFTLAAVNLVGPGPVVRASARTNKVPSAPYRLEATATHDTATISWTPPESTGGEPISGYVVSYVGGGAQATEVRCGTATTCLVPGLLPDTSYSFTLYAENTAGRGPGATVSVKTAGPPLVPTALRTGTTTRSTAALSWRAPADGGSPITHYRVTYWRADEPQSTAVYYDCPTAALECTVPGLYRATQYKATVAAVNAAGIGPAVSVPVPFETLPGPASVPLNVEFTAGATQIFLSWAKPEDTGGRSIIQYYVTVQRVGSSTVRTQSVGTYPPLRHTITGLSPSATYEVTLKAQTVMPGDAVTLLITTPPFPE